MKYLLNTIKHVKAANNCGLRLTPCRLSSIFSGTPINTLCDPESPAFKVNTKTYS